MLTVHIGSTLPGADGLLEMSLLSIRGRPGMPAPDMVRTGATLPAPPPRSPYAEYPRQGRSSAGAGSALTWWNPRSGSGEVRTYSDPPLPPYPASVALAMSSASGLA